MPAKNVEKGNIKMHLATIPVWIAQQAVRAVERARRSRLRYGQVHTLAAEVSAFLPAKQAEVC